MCPATPRDLLKPKQQRVAEVMQSIQLQSGQANSQQIITGLLLKPETEKFEITAGEYTLSGTHVPYSITAKTAQTVPAGAETTSVQKCYVLIELDAAGTVYKTVSALTTGTPVLPALTATRIAIGYLSIPVSFTVGTTHIETANCVAIKYDAGYVSPTSGF